MLQSVEHVVDRTCEGLDSTIITYGQVHLPVSFPSITCCRDPDKMDPDKMLSCNHASVYIVAALMLLGLVHMCASCLTASMCAGLQTGSGKTWTVLGHLTGGQDEVRPIISQGQSSRTEQTPSMPAVITVRHVRT